MERYIRLNLNEESDRKPVSNPPSANEKVPDEALKRLNRFAKKFAGRAAKEYGRSSSGIFTK
jgi:hypothetical protein